MATEAWDAAYEATPANTDKRHLGDDEFRDLKKNIRESLQQGGHYDPNAGSIASTTENDRGRHVVDAGGSGVSPHIYKSDGSTKLVDYTDTLVDIKEALNVDGAVTFGPPLTLNDSGGGMPSIVAESSGADHALLIDGGMRAQGPVGGHDYALVNGPTTLTLDGLTDDSDKYDISTSGGAVTVNLSGRSTGTAGGGCTWLFYKRAGNILSFNPATTPSFFLSRYGQEVRPVFPADFEGYIRITQWISINVFMETFPTKGWGTYDNIGSPYTLDTGDVWGPIHFVNTGSGSVTINLPAASTMGTARFMSRFIKIASANTLTITPNGADTINGAASAVIAAGTAGTGFGEIQLFNPSGTNWRAAILNDAT